LQLFARGVGGKRGGRCSGVGTEILSKGRKKVGQKRVGNALCGSKCGTEVNKTNKESGRKEEDNKEVAELLPQ